MNSRVYLAVVGVLSGAAFPAQRLAAAAGDAAADTGSLEEITVTAQRRTENIQDVPISIQALTSQTLQQLNVTTFDDYVKFLPNVTSANNGPGQNEVFMRGVSAGSQASQGSAATGLAPNVAIYLDNQSGQMPNRNLDIYAVDLDRIEVLEGPQGTLFGAGAQAGVVRYITNQPKLDRVEAYAKAGYGVTAHGDPNSDVQFVFNLPLLTDRLGVRAVIYNDRRGGYIDNVPATFKRQDSDYGIHYAQYATGCSTGTPTNGVCPVGATVTTYGVPPGSPTINNYNIARNAINPATYQGIRAEVLYRFNQDWDLLLSQSYQTLDTQGVFYQQPLSSNGEPLHPLQVTLFNDAYAKDRFESTAWTLNGRIGPLRAVYTGGYLVRNIDQAGDYTNYVRGVYADYYQCYGPTAANPTLTSTCFTPTSYWHTNERNYHQQHEFRLSTPDDWRARAILGAFWEDNKLTDRTIWYYKTMPSCTATLTTGCLAPLGTVPGTTVTEPGIYTGNASFGQDETRITRQLAFFLSADYDIIPKVLTLTAGTRHFRFDNTFLGSVGGSFGCFQAPAVASGCQNYLPYAQPPFVYSFNLDAQHLKGSESGFKSRFNLTWHVTPDVMVYYTFSQGYRPGGFNQNGGAAHAPGTDGVAQYLIPRGWKSDNLTNNEIGWKTEFFGRHLQWNGAVYRDNWDNAQIEFFNPGLVGNLFYNTNGQNFLIKGIETSLIARPLSGLTLQGAAAWNQSRQTNSPALIDNNPASNNYGKPITVLCTTTPCSPVSNPFGPVGAPTANSPPIQLSARIRYDWTIGGYLPFVQVGMTHSGHSYTQAGANPNFNIGGAVTTSRGRFENPAYTTWDASAGVARDAWVFTVYCENLSNSNASVFVSTDQFIVEQTPLRPRVIEATFSYQFR